MLKFALAAAALSVATPALAAETAVYGPANTAAASAATAQIVDPEILKFKAIQRSATRWELAYQALNAVDVVQTCEALSTGRYEERNPLFGKNPKCGTLVGVKAAAGVLHYLLFSHVNARNPKTARTFSQLSVGIQGTVVGLNFGTRF
jgi:hypothetical protein